MGFSPRGIRLKKADLCEFSPSGAKEAAEKGCISPKNPEIRPSVAKANADLIDLIGMAKAMPLQN